MDWTAIGVGFGYVVTVLVVLVVVVGLSGLFVLSIRPDFDEPTRAEWKSLRKQIDNTK
ncbi:adenylate cyclase [Rhodococcus sp. WMMA185]|nr:adenylate cyclase [Rhodococcus sp. WMMA185]